MLPKPNFFNFDGLKRVKRRNLGDPKPPGGVT